MAREALSAVLTQRPHVFGIPRPREPNPRAARSPRRRQGPASHQQRAGGHRAPVSLRRPRRHTACAHLQRLSCCRGSAPARRLCPPRPLGVPCPLSTPPVVSDGDSFSPVAAFFAFSSFRNLNVACDTLRGHDLILLSRERKGDRAATRAVPPTGPGEARTPGDLQEPRLGEGTVRPGAGGPGPAAWPACPCPFLPTPRLHVPSWKDGGRGA